MTSKIEWTGDTWNPLVGCSFASPGCRNCYAMGEAWRKMFHPNAAIAAKFAGTVRKVKGVPVWTGRINFSEAALSIPLRRRKPQLYFVNSLSDLFHENVTDEQIDRVFAVMALSPQHRFQVLTKRADRMRAYFARPDVSVRVGLEALALCCESAAANPKSKLGAGVVIKATDINPGALSQWPLPNVCLGVSVEDQRRADERREDFRATPAALKFVSYEPAIGPVDWAGWDFVDQIVSGGESGRRPRRSEADWHRATLAFCAPRGIAYCFKQWGAWLPAGQIAAQTGLWAPSCGSPLLTTKRNAGRLLDGVQHDGKPAAWADAAAAS